MRHVLTSGSISHSGHMHRVLPLVRLRSYTHPAVHALKAEWKSHQHAMEWVAGVKKLPRERWVTLPLEGRECYITYTHTHTHTHTHTTHPQIPLICLLLEVDLSPLDVDLVLCLLNQWNMVRVMLSSFWPKKVSYWQPPYLSKCPLLKISHSVTGKFVGEAHAEREQNLKLSTPAELPANSQDQIASPGSKPSCTYILQPLVKLPHWCCISGADKPSLLSPAETACLWAGYFVLLSH